MQRILFISFLTLILACDPLPDDSYQNYFVVESTLVAGEPLPHLWLYTTSPINENFRFEQLAVTDANVQIHLLAQDGDIEQSFSYTANSEGIYEAVQADAHIVQARRTYSLEITGLNHPDIAETRISGSTVVPDTFRAVRIGFESEEVRPPYVPGSIYDVEYQQDDQIVVDITRGELAPGRSQNFYIFTIIADDTAQSNLTPFYYDILVNNADEDEIDLTEVYENESDIINQENYILNSDGTVSISLPWIAIAFFGQNSIVANSLDDNMYDFKRSRTTQLGGGTVSPGEIYNLIYHLDGAIGYFGSISRSNFVINIARPPELPPFED